MAHLQVDKIFVGGISSNTSKESMVNYFKEKFNGKVTRVSSKNEFSVNSTNSIRSNSCIIFIQVDMKINQTGENKGFAFLTFDSTEGWGYNFFISKLY